jgi:sRNA-binding carbon storage regulator CsrA
MKQIYNMVARKYWWVKFSDENIAEYIDKEIQKIAIDLKENLEIFRGKIYEAIVKDPEIKAKIIEYIKKNESTSN